MLKCLGCPAGSAPSEKGASTSVCTKKNEDRQVPARIRMHIRVRGVLDRTERRGVQWRLQRKEGPSQRGAHKHVHKHNTKEFPRKKPNQKRSDNESTWKRNIKPLWKMPAHIQKIVVKRVQRGELQRPVKFLPTKAFLAHKTQFTQEDE